MSVSKYFDRLERMDSLISMRATGTPVQFALRMKISRSTLYDMLNAMKAMGADIRYSVSGATYYYADGKRLRLRVEEDD